MTCAKIPTTEKKNPHSLYPLDFPPFCVEQTWKSYGEGLQDFAARWAPQHAASRSCVREGKQRGPGQMFPFTNAAKEQGMPSSLPWRYLHFTTSSNNHATSSLGKENTTRPRSLFISVFIKRAKIKLFSYSSSEILLGFILPVKQDTSIPSLIHFNYQPLPFCTRDCSWSIRDS